MRHFPEARLVMSRVERQAGPPRYYGDLRPLEWPKDTRARLVDGDEEIAPGVTLLTTPGHSPGHLSLLVELADSGAVILACDAISRERELATGVNEGASDDEAARRSAQRLVDLAHDRGALLVYGHDPEQSRTLRRAPEIYR
jgi:N-acyl homoserine lactone hydrolase